MSNTTTNTNAGAATTAQTKIGVRDLEPIQSFNSIADIKAGEVVRITKIIASNAAHVVRDNGDTWTEIGIDGIRAEWVFALTPEVRTNPTRIKNMITGQELTFQGRPPESILPLSTYDNGTHWLTLDEWETVTAWLAAKRAAQADEYANELHGQD